MSRGRTPGAKPIDVNAAQRRNLALEMRIRGASQRQIAGAVGVSQSAVSKMIRKALAEQQAERVDDLRAIEGERLERLHAAMWKPATEQGNMQAAGVIVRASERRSKLMGLDLAKDDAGGALRCDYHIFVEITTTEDAERALADLRARIQADELPYMGGEIVDAGPGVMRLSAGTLDGAIEGALALGRSVTPEPPLSLASIILRREYKPAV